MSQETTSSAGRRRIVVGLVVTILGVVAFLNADPTGLLVMLPAVPLYLLSALFNPSAARGVFWDSAHGPPFLTGAGISLVYFLPALILLISGAFAKPEEKSSAPGT